MWRNAIVKIDELSARMEETYDDFDDGIQAVEEAWKTTKTSSWILPMMSENEDGESIACRQVDQNSIDVFKFPKHLIQNEIHTAKGIVNLLGCRVR